MIIFDRLPNERAREYALRVIRENIILLELEPGSKISENELAEQIGVSRTPIREALVELGKIDIIQVVPQKGIYISLIDYEKVEEAEFMRVALEKAVVEKICEQENDFSKLDENLKKQKDNDHKSDYELNLMTDNEFHKELFRMANKMYAYELLKTIMIYYDRVRTLTLKKFQNQYVIDAHEEILNALKKRDAKKSGELMVKHLKYYRSEAATLREEYPQYFSSELLGY